MLGGLAGAAVLYVIASGKAGFTLADGFAANGYAEHSPGRYSLVACLVAEVVLTFMFLMIILGATDRRAPAGFAPIAIGLGLTLIHLIGIPVTNLSVNPARARARRCSSGAGRWRNCGCSGSRRSSAPPVRELSTVSALMPAPPAAMGLAREIAPRYCFGYFVADAAGLLAGGQASDAIVRRRSTRIATAAPQQTARMEAGSGTAMKLK